MHARMKRFKKMQEGHIALPGKFLVKKSVLRKILKEVEKPDPLKIIWYKSSPKLDSPHTEDLDHELSTSSTGYVEEQMLEERMDEEMRERRLIQWHEEHGLELHSDMYSECDCHVGVSQ